MNALPLIDPVFAHAAAAALGAVLILGAIDKLREPLLFRDTVENYQLLPAPAAHAVARMLPLAELAAGVLLLPTATRVIGALLALTLLAIVTAAVAINLRRGHDRIDCGCGGGDHLPLSPGLVVRNMLLALLALVAAAPTALRNTTWLDLAATAFAAIFVLGLYALANAMLAHHSRLTELRKLP